MKPLGQGGNARPKAKSGEFEHLMTLLDAASKPEKAKKILAELVEATAANEKLRAVAIAAIADAKDRDAAAREAEERARTELAAADTAKLELQADTARAQDKQEKEDQRLKEWNAKLEAFDSEISGREQAIRRAFDGYCKEK